MEIELGASKKEETGSKRNGIGQKARVITSVSIHLYFCFIFSPLPANFEREKTKFKPSQAETKWKKKYIFWDDIKVLYIGTTLFQFFFFGYIFSFFHRFYTPLGAQSSFPSSSNVCFPFPIFRLATHLFLFTWLTFLPASCLPVSFIVSFLPLSSFLSAWTLNVVTTRANEYYETSCYLRVVDSTVCNKILNNCISRSLKTIYTCTVWSTTSNLLVGKRLSITDSV